MKSVFAIATFALFTASAAFAAEQTWTGKISDSNCGKSHKSTIEHSGQKLTDHDCALVCVKGGAKYVFVHQGKVLNIENQDFAGLEEHAGHLVHLSGEMTGDTIKVTKIEMPETKGKKGA